MTERVMRCDCGPHNRPRRLSVQCLSVGWFYEKHGRWFKLFTRNHREIMTRQRLKDLLMAADSVFYEEQKRRERGEETLYG